MQESILGPDFYIILSNSLLSLLSLRSVTYVNDFKFIVDVRSHTREDVQCEIDKVVDWSEAHLMPLSTEKCAVLHCSLKQPNYTYVLGDHVLKTVDSFVDLGVTRTSDSGHSSQCSAIAAKAAKAAYVSEKLSRLEIQTFYGQLSSAMSSQSLFMHHHYGALRWQKMLH